MYNEGKRRDAYSSVRVKIKLKDSETKDRRDYIEKYIMKSQKEIDISTSENGMIVTLSTCTSRTSIGRFIVQATASDKRE